MRLLWIALCLAALTPGLRADEAPTDEPPGDKKNDAADVRHVLDNLSLVRDMTRLSKPDSQRGLWEKLVDQPYYTPLQRAQKLLFHGQYADAEKYFDAVLADSAISPADRQAAMEGRLAAILRQDKQKDRDRFAAAVAALPEAAKSTPALLTLRAQALLQTGQMDQARSLLAAFVDQKPSLTHPIDAPVLALYNCYASILAQQANYLGAVAIYDQVGAVAMEALPDDPAARTEIAIALYQSGMLTAAGDSRTREALRRFTEVIEQVDRTYWPAHLEAARILLAGHNTRDGGARVEATLQLNPNSFDAHLLALQFAIAGYSFDKAGEELDTLKTLSDGALIRAMEGRLILKQRLPDKAIAPLRQAIERNPDLPEARGWLAGAYYLAAQPALAAEQLAAVKTAEGAGHPNVLYECAEVLRDARQFDQAEKLYLDAAKVAPWWSEPYAALAQLYLETGQEDKAKTAYDRAFKIDPFNMRAYNQLTLLDYLTDTQTFRVLETPHFILRYTAQDQILAQMAAEWLEQRVYPEVTSDFGVSQLPVKTKIEFYPSHEQFGVRTTGLPWIGTVGACTGNVIAMDVPRGGAKDLMGAFDWARVLRHEFTHTVTLAITRNRIPHWLTEAAACSEEQAPRDWENCQLLCSNYRAGTLFKFEDLNWGFIRPKRSIDRQLAYMQSQWIYEYLLETFGQPKMLQFLAAFRDGKTEAEAFRQVYGKPMEQINQDFLVWAGRQIDAWGLPSEPLPKRDAAEKAVKADPANADAKVTLAWLLLNGGADQTATGEIKQAETLLRDAIALDPRHVRARELLGAILKTRAEVAKAAGKLDDAAARLAEARVVLEAVVQDDPERPVAWRVLGLMAMADKRWDDAEKAFLRLQQLRPLEDTSYTNLAGIYLVRKENQKAIGQLTELQRHEQHDERIPRKLAELLRAQGALREAETMAYKAVRINPYNAVNHQLMGQILLEEAVPARAVEFFSHATELQPRITAYWEGLADASGLAGDKTRAAEAAKKAVELAPDSPAGKWLTP